MNWALSAVDRFSVISNSDAHSPDKLGREATVFDMEMSYPGLCAALRGAPAAVSGGPGSRPGILETIEFFPQEGKYHYDGHRTCGIRVSPAEAKAAGGICPVCGKALTRGVMGRVLELADRPVNEEEPCPQDFSGTNRRPYRSLIPLREILSELLGCGGASKKVDAAYNSIINSGRTELSILAEVRERDLERLKAPGISGELLARAIGRMRSGMVSISPGYDGEYGVIRVCPAGAGQDETGLFDLPAERGRRRPINAAPVKAALQTPVPAAAPASVRRPFVPDSGQERVIACNDRRVLVVAGPGAGKTAVLAARAARLIQEGAAPSSILAVSFTVKAAAELRERITSFAGSAAGGVRVSTFHAFCAALLREEGKDLIPDFTILSEEEREKILREICGGSGRGGTSPGRLGNYIEARKRYLLLPGETANLRFDSSLGIGKILSYTSHTEQIPPPVPELEALYNTYRERLKGLHLADYEDLIAGAVRLLASRKETLQESRRRFRHIFVDEYQDINFSQYVLVRLLVPSNREEDEGAALWVIGDPNQAIYGFRGSDKRFIDRFAEDYPGAVRLELLRSFRCADPIIRAAGRLADAKLESAAGERGTVSLFRREYPSDKSEAEGIARTIAALLGGASFFALDSGAASDGEGCAAPGDCAVLVRAAALAVPIVKALKDHGIPFVLSSQSLWWEEEPAKDILDLIREKAGKNEEKNTGAADTDPAGEIMAAWETLAGSGRLKGRGKEAPKSVAELARLAGLFGSSRALLDALAYGTGIPDAESSGVRVMTIHASKGLEFDYVFAAGLEEGMLPFTLYNNEEQEKADIDEEKRLLYVAMTRARRGLWLSMARNRNFRGRKLSCQPSRFLAELEDLVPLEAPNRSLKRESQPSLF
jgi:superfamily I DNA/RNA helicase